MPAHKLTRRRDFLRLGILGAASAALVAACAPAAPPTPTPAPAPKPAEAPKPAAQPTPVPAAQPKPAAEPVTLRLHARSGVEDEMFGKVLPPFEEKFKAKVSYEHFPGGEYFQKLQTLAAGGTIGDVIHIFTGDASFQLFFSGGVIVPIDDYVKKDSFSLEQFYKYSADGCKLDGKLGGLPFKSHPSRVGLFYNETIFEKAGLKVPDLEWSLDDLVEAAKKLTKDTDNDGKLDQFGYTHPWHDHQFYMIICRQFGSDLYAEEGKKNLLNSPEAIKGFTWHYDMSNTHKVVLNPLQTTPNPSEMFISGKIAMMRANVGTKAAFRAIKDFKWNMTLAPKGPTGKRGSVAETDVMSVTKFSKQADLAWELLKHVTSKEAGIGLASQTGNRSSTPGGRPDVYNSPEHLGLPYPAGVQERSLKAMNEVEPYAQAWNFRGQEVLRTIDPMADLLLLGKEQPTKEFFNRMSTEVQAILDKPRP